MSDLVKALLIGAVVYFGTSHYQKQQDIPVTPSVPTGALADLIPSEYHAGVGAFYRSFSIIVGDGGCSTLGNFREAQRIAVKVYQRSGKLPDLSAINAPIGAALTAAVGLDDAPLDEAKRKALADALSVIAMDFGA
jgi:hypothetical protein